MKKIKKSISLILAVIMLLSALPMQIFALGPALEKIEFSDNVPVSNRMIQYYASKYYSDVDEDTRVTLNHLNHDYYDYKCYFSGGATYDTGDIYDIFYPLGIDSVFLDMEVSPLECQRAVDEGIGYVKVYVTAIVDKLIGEAEYYNFVLEKEIVEGIVRQVRLLDVMPEEINEDKPELSFEGKSFEIEYYDGRKETRKFIVEDGIFPYLDDVFVECYFDIEKETDGITGEERFFKTVRIIFIDSVEPIYKEEIKLAYDEIEILDYEFDGKGGVTHIKYSLKDKNGNITERECSFDSGVAANGYEVIDKVDGYPVTLHNNIDDEGGTNYYLYITYGYNEEDIHDSAYGDAKDCCKCMCHQEGFLYIIGYIMMKIWKLFRSNHYCRCNAVHWWE